MLRADKSAKIVLLPWSFLGMFTGRYALQSGRRIFDLRWKRDWFERASAVQVDEPVQLFLLGRSKLLVVSRLCLLGRRWAVG
jgi:hypothetical protein